MTSATHLLRRALDFLYAAAGWLAAAFLVLILVIIVFEVLARWTGISFPGSTDYAGYCMAASSFLALAYTLNHGAHIRVGLLVTRLGRYRRIGEIWAFGIGAALSAYFAWYAVRLVVWSRKLGDVSQGQDATPLWIPQLAMAIGGIIFALALFDHLVRLLLHGTHGIEPELLEERRGE